MKSKNIIFIMADQLGAAFINCYGSGVESTPTLDRLASRGARYERCYATSPVCTPNRACLLTGRSPVVNGMVTNNYCLPADCPAYPQVLRCNGYHTGGFGKFHQTPMMWEHAPGLQHLGFDEVLVTEDPRWGPYMEWIRTGHPDYFDAALALAWGRPRDFPAHAAADYAIERKRKAEEKYLHPRRQNSAWPSMYESPLPPALNQTAWITDRGLDFMQRHLEHTPDQPFFCHISYVDPHDPYDPPVPYSTMFSPDDMQDPIPARWIQEDCQELYYHRNWIGFTDIADKPEAIRKLRALYHGSIRFIDDQIGRVADFLTRHDLWTDTVLVFSTDHGDMMGDHQQIAKGSTPYDTSIRVPLIIAGGGTASATPNRLVCGLDFFPTFCDWARIPEHKRPPLEGKSFARSAEGASDPDTWKHIWVGMGHTESVISDDGWRLSLFHSDHSPNQLMHLKEDPHEQVNLYANPDYTRQKVHLLEALSEHASRIRITPQYRNLPARGDYRWIPHPEKGMVPACPRYTDTLETPVWDHRASGNGE